MKIYNIKELRQKPIEDMTVFEFLYLHGWRGEKYVSGIGYQLKGIGIHKYLNTVKWFKNICLSAIKEGRPISQQAKEYFNL